jgi:methylthioribose-1-phosphate isomerase
MQNEASRAATLEAIWRKRHHGGPMDRIADGRLVAGEGLLGNADQGGRRQVTIVEAEVWDAISREFGRFIDPAARRANLLVRGVSLKETRNRVLKVGPCRIRILGETRPCQVMDEAVPGLRAALSPDWRAGAFGEVLEGGPIAVGDAVAWDESARSPLDTVRWDNDAVRIIDQTRLPSDLLYRRLETVESVAAAIETLAVRGAPAIGIAAGYGIALAARRAARGEVRSAVLAARERLARTRPTAVNLFAALDRLDRVVREGGEASLAEALLKEAHRILDEDLDTGRRIGDSGLAILPERRPVRVLTHCNAGALATGGWGTALAPIYAAKERGIQVEVWADETRPLLQGRRLTAWELARAGIPVRVLVDGAAASALLSHAVDLVIVGADRIARNGDTANKIGTLSVALAAQAAGIPFYVAAPGTTFDFQTADGASIPVEQRSPQEVLEGGGPEGVQAWNPAFDVTPRHLIRGWITEAGVLEPPFAELQP